MHFGLYLHRKGIITAEQFVAALEAQTRCLVRIGQLALEEGMLSARDVFDVLRAQHHAPRERFGELAIEMGLLTRDDLTRLLMIQSDRKIPLEEVLVRQGVLSPERAFLELTAFRNSHDGGRWVDETATAVRPPHTRRFARNGAVVSLAT
jgi:hypothetical protein